MQYLRNPSLFCFTEFHLKNSFRHGNTEVFNYLIHSEKKSNYHHLMYYESPVTPKSEEPIVNCFYGGLGICARLSVCGKWEISQDQETSLWDHWIYCPLPFSLLFTIKACSQSHSRFWNEYYCRFVSKLSLVNCQIYQVA